MRNKNKKEEKSVYDKKNKSKIVVKNIKKAKLAQKM